MERKSMSNRTLVKIALAVLLLTGSSFAQFGSHDVLYVVSAPTGACIAGSRLEVVITTGVVYSCQSLTWTALAGGTGISSLSITVPTGLAVSPGSLSSPGTFAFTWNGSLPVAQVPFQSLTTTGTSGPATLAAGVLNIPQYSGGGGGGIGGSGTIGTLPIFFTNTTTIGNSNVTESGGLLNVADVNGIALTATGGALYSGKIQTGTSVVVPSPNNFSTFLGSDNVYRAQLASGSLAITPASIAIPASPSTGFGVSGTGINFQTTNLTASTPGDIATYDANGNTQDSGTLGSSLANTALGNLASVGVNLALTPASDATISLDSLTKRYVNFWASGVYGWTNGSGTADTGLSRDAAGTVDVGNGTAGDKSGTLKAASINASASVSAGTAPGVCGTATGCFGATEGTAANMSVTASQDAFAADATAHAFKMTLNGGAIFLSAMNASLAPTGTIALSFASAPSGSKCVQTSGTAGLVTEAAGACGAGGSGTVNTGTATHLAYYASSTTAVSDAGADLVFNGTHTYSAATTLLFDLSGATGAAAFKVPSNTTNTASAAGAITFDTTNKNYHGFVNGADALFMNTAAAPTTNVIPKATIASGNTLYGNSSITDNGTSVTTTDTGGYVGPTFTANGTTAGFSDFAQGTTSAAVAPCNTANSACFQAPAAVTSYVANVPAAAPTNNFSAWTFSNASPSVGSFNKMQQAAFLTTTYTNATTGMTSLTGLSFSVEANTNYTMICNMAYHSSVLTDDLSVQLTGPASPTAVTITYITEVSSTGVSDGVATAFSTPITATGSPVALTNYPFTVAMTLINGANAGTVQVQAASSATGTITILPGSCQLQ